VVQVERQYLVQVVQRPVLHQRQNARGKYLMALYKGYSSVNRDFGPYRLSDNDLIIQDLLNNLNIRKGEKLMNPDFGCIVWDRLFDPLTPALKQDIVKNIDTIIANDPRLAVTQSTTIQESPDGHGLVLNFSLQFAGTNKLASLNVKFDSQFNKLFVL
jgi:phage baseplate assembly protein W